MERFYIFNIRAIFGLAIWTCFSYGHPLVAWTAILLQLVIQLPRRVSCSR